MRGPLLFLTSQPRVLRCVGNVYAQIPAPGAPPVWQYISLPRGPVEPGTSAGVHLENRILRGWTLPSVASGQTSNHLKWSNLDLFFARPPRGGPEKFLFLY